MIEIKWLNKRGSRFITYCNGRKISHTFKTLSGKKVKRVLLEQREFGIWGMAKIRWQGKIIETLMDSILID